MYNNSFGTPFKQIADDECEKPPNKKKVRKIDNFLLLKKIGRGSFAKVYYGININTQKEYAIKRINLSDLSRTSYGVMQLEREVRLMRTVSHPNILKLYYVFHAKEEKCVYLVLEYFDCGSLGSMIENHHFTDGEIKSIIFQVASALHYFHTVGYVHQDIKPDNILMSSDGRAVLADFGIGHSFMSARMVIGSPAYQAPEAISDDDDEEDFSNDEDLLRSQIESKIEQQPEVIPPSPREEDVWALGVTVFQLLYEKLPYDGNNLFEIVHNIKSQPLSFPEGGDSDLVELIKKMLVIDPRRRISMEDVLSYSCIKDAQRISNTLTPKVVSKEPVGIISEIHVERIDDHTGYYFSNLATKLNKKLSRPQKN